MDTLNQSAFISLTIQFITGVIEAKGLTYKVSSEDKIVKDILALEIVVQSIEFLFYMYLVYMIYTNQLTKSITSHRYMDWSLTTPTMLISFVLFFKYLREPTRNIRLFDSLKEETNNIVKIVIGNAFMLFFGFLGEVGIMNQPLGVALGFIPFAYIFKILYSEYGKYTTLSKTIFYFSFLVWGGYGVAAVLPFVQKNIIYNILDLFSKNIYGLFLYYYLGTKQII